MREFFIKSLWTVIKVWNSSSRKGERELTRGHKKLSRGTESPGRLETITSCNFHQEYTTAYI